MMRLKTAITVTLTLLLLVLASGNANAGTKWICSINEAVECVEGGYIDEPNFFGLARPTFMRVDVDKKEITLLAPKERKGEVTKIDRVEKGKDFWIFTGIENYRAWSMMITQSGHMTVSITYDGVTWTVFGNAMFEE